ncbi:MAG: hypothetical protein NTY19_36605 [Planctomycetota bacterium]|nr:hypothetical protein [Planctomycetota bacterium]
MMATRNVIDSATCNWCEKECCEGQTDNGPVIRLCWNDLKRTVKMQTLTARSEVAEKV